MIDESRDKLEQKDNYSAELYFKIGEFKAAAVAFEQIIRKYPDSKFVDYYLYKIIESSFKYARNSIPDKQEDRFNQVKAHYNEFVRKFPKANIEVK